MLVGPSFGGYISENRASEGVGRQSHSFSYGVVAIFESLAEVDRGQRTKNDDTVTSATKKRAHKGDMVKG